MSAAVRYDPVDGKEVVEGTEYAEKDGLYFSSLQTQQMFYKFLENGFEVAFQDGKPSLRKTQGKPIWMLRSKDGKEGLYLRNSNECRKVVPGLPAGEYVFRAECPELHKSTLRSTSARTMTVTMEVTSGDGVEKIRVATSELKAQASLMEVKFTVWQKQSNATFVVDCRSHSILKKIYVKATLLQFPLAGIKEEINTARRESKAIQLQGEYIVELTKGAGGVGMTLGWERSLKAVVVKSVDANGAAARTKKLAMGDIVMGIQGRRVQGVSFKKVIKMLRNVPRTVILIMSKAPEGFVPTRTAARTRKLENLPAQKRRKGAPPPPPRPGQAQPGSHSPSRATKASRPPPPRPNRPASLGHRHAAPGARNPPPPPTRPSTSVEQPVKKSPPPPPTRRSGVPQAQAPGPVPVRHQPPQPPTRKQTEEKAVAHKMPPPPPLRRGPPANIPVKKPVQTPPTRDSNPTEEPVRKQPPPPPVSHRKQPPVQPPVRSTHPPPAPVAQRKQPPPQPQIPVKTQHATPPPPPQSRTTAAPPPAPVSQRKQPPPPPTKTQTQAAIKPKAQVPTATVTPPVATPAPAPAPAPAPSGGSGDFGKYEKMRKSRLPDGAIFNAWVRDGCPAYPAGFWSADWEASAQKEVAKRSGGAAPAKIKITKQPAKQQPAKTGMPANPLAGIEGFKLSSLKKVEKSEEAPKQSLPASNPLAAINGFDRSALKKVSRDEGAQKPALAPSRPTNPLDELKNFNRAKLRSAKEPVKRSDADKEAAKKSNAGGFQAALGNALDQIRSAVASDSEDDDDDDWNDDDDWAM